MISALLPKIRDETIDNILASFDFGEGGSVFPISQLEIAVNSNHHNFVRFFHQKFAVLVKF